MAAQRRSPAARALKDAPSTRVRPRTRAHARGSAGRAELRVRIGPMTLDNPVLTASGTYGYGEEYAHAQDPARLGAVVTKTVTLEPRVGNPPARNVGAGEVDLEAGDAALAAQRLEQPHELGRGLTADRGDDRRTEGEQPGQLLGAEHAEPDVLEPDRVEHAPRRLGDAHRRIADARLQRHRLGHDRAQGGGILDMRVLLAVAVRARGREDRVRKPHRADAHAQVGARASGGGGGPTGTAGRGRHQWIRSQSRERASNTGPSVQHMA